MRIPSHQKILVGATALIGVSVLAIPGTAQTQGDVDELPEDDAIEEIIVTGTRIKRAGVDTFYPAISVGTEELEDGAFANVADALNQVPAFRDGTSPYSGPDTLSVGQNFINYLGFGTQRTLTLVNGRRFVPANTPSIFGETGGSQVDLNTIPTALVERIETIGVGGAPIYGADAMAGTVNIILKDRFEGMQLRLRHGTTADGDGDFEEVSFLGGANFSNDRGNVTLSMESHRQDGLLLNDRPQYTINNPFWGSPEPRNPGDPNTEFVRRIYSDHRIDIFTYGGLIDPFGFTLPSFGVGAMQDGNFWQFSANSNLVPYTPGTRFPGSPIFALGGDGPDFFSDVGQIRSPLDRDILTTRVNYDLTDRVTFSSDVIFSNTWSRKLLGQSTSQSWALGGASGALRFPADHPFLHPDAQALLAGMGATEFFLHRNNRDITNNSSEREQSLWNTTAGLDGDFKVGERNFNWSIWATHGETDGETSGEDVVTDRFISAIDVRRLSAADLAAVDADAGSAEQAILAFSGTPSAGVGDIVCESVYQAASGDGVTDADLPAIQGCAPLNLFGEGVRSEAAREWVTADMMTQSDIEQSTFNVNFGGDWLNLPAGWAAFNIGFETRNESAKFVPGSGFESSIGRQSLPLLETGGAYDTEEFFGELAIPLISADMDLPFMEFAELNGAIRQIEHSNAGTDIVWTVGTIIAPFRDLAIRANYTESARAPSLVELFSPPVPGSAGGEGTDPCDFRNVDKGAVPDTRRANCMADIANYDPDTFESSLESPVIGTLGTISGNPDLINESADSYAIGMSYEPGWIDNLLLTADYINIDVKDAIASVGLGKLMSSCYDATSFPNVPGCIRFVRDDAGQVVDYTGGQINAASGEFESLQLGASYGFDVAALFSSFSDAWRSKYLGRFDTRIRIDHPLERRFSLLGEPAVPSSIGGWGDPEWSGTFDFIWSSDNARIFWRILWQDNAKFDTSGDTLYEDLNGNLVDSTDAPFISNVTISYNFAQLFEAAPNETIIQLSIGNLFRYELDVYQSASVHAGIAPVLGRTYTLTLQGTW